ncbi:hypothetical protein [Sphingobium lignivorans]|uniref:Oxidoreductase n=1 Tax=Sphingobium lignivorans TaxID=2735886 RepID=A0ABR6NF99_9SPHN|nr:hypothetical protein [Sphingobium lignivorans]MBB5985950.1 hypothetical protein [Sphingobium lignivorans]
MIDEALREFATPRQIEFIDAINKHGSAGAAERALELSDGLIRKSMRRLKANAARKGYAPGHWEGGTAPGYLMGKVTVHRTPKGVVQQWERQHPDLELFEQFKEGVKTFIGDTVGPIVPAPPVAGRDNDVIPWINIGDGHLGMLAHEAETGANFDLKIAERELCAAISIAVDDMVHHDRAVLQDMGDMTHYENFSGTTEASGHALDYDTRFPKMIRVYSRVMRFIIDKLLEKVNTLDVIINQGNHSRTNDIWMAELVRVAYGASGRVNVLDNDNKFIAYRMGNTFVMCHHSDKCRPAQLAHVMATDFARDWGECQYRYIDIGHIHHNMVLKEHPGVVIESFNQLANKDLWAHDGGYRSRQCLTIIKRSRTYGDIGRRIIPIGEVRDRIAAAHAAVGSAAPYVPKERRAFTV